MAANEKKKTTRATNASLATDLERVEAKLDSLISVLDWQFKTEFLRGYQGARRELKAAGLVKED